MKSFIFVFVVNEFFNLFRLILALSSEFQNVFEWLQFATYVSIAILKGNVEVKGGNIATLKVKFQGSYA